MPQAVVYLCFLSSQKSVILPVKYGRKGNFGINTNREQGVIFGGETSKKPPKETEVAVLPTKYFTKGNQAMNDRTPFTYLLIHKPTGKKYYGVHFRKGCLPEHLWTKYFSSSPTIKKLIKQDGADSFDYQVRKIFETGDEAVDWEHKFLLRVGAARSEDWLNRHNGGYAGGHIPTEEMRKNVSKFHKGRKRSKATVEKLRKTAQEQWKKQKAEGYTLSKSAVEKSKATQKKMREAGTHPAYSKEAIAKGEETRRKMREAGLIDYSNPEERRRKMAEAKRGKVRRYLPSGKYFYVDPPAESAANVLF